jgi:hypothetical protein
MYDLPQTFFHHLPLWSLIESFNKIGNFACPCMVGGYKELLLRVTCIAKVKVFGGWQTGQNNISPIFDLRGIKMRKTLNSGYTGIRCPRRVSIAFTYPRKVIQTRNTVSKAHRDILPRISRKGLIGINCLFRKGIKKDLDNILGTLHPMGTLCVIWCHSRVLKPHFYSNTQCTLPFNPKVIRDHPASMLSSYVWYSASKWKA